MFLFGRMDQRILSAAKSVGKAVKILLGLWVHWNYVIIVRAIIIAMKKGAFWISWKAKPFI